MNKDEAEKCLELGRTYLRKGEYAKAIKFLDKSLRLFPLPGVAEMKQRAEAEATRASSTPTSQGSERAAAAGAARRRASSAATSQSREAPQTPQGGSHLRCLLQIF